MPAYPGSVGQVFEIQRLLLECMRNPETKPLELAGCARAWEQLEERKRILRGKPLPGQLRPDLDPASLAKLARRAQRRQIRDVDAIAYDVPKPADKAADADTLET